MASHAVTAMLAFVTGLLYPGNIFDYITTVFNHKDPPVQAPVPVGIISATKTIRIPSGTDTPALDLDFQYGEGAGSYLPLMLFLSVLVLSLLAFAYIHRLAHNATASFLVTTWRSALEAAATEISDLKEQLKSRAAQLKACEDQIAQLSRTVRGLDSAKDLQTLLCIQQEDMLAARDSTIDELEAREKDLTIDMQQFHMLKEQLQSRADELTVLRFHMRELEKARDILMAKVAALRQPTEVVTGDGTPAEDSTTITDDGSEISQPRSSLSAKTPPFVPSAMASMEALTAPAPEEADEDDDGASAGEGDEENGQAGTGGGKKQRRRKRGKRKSAKTLIQSPANAPKGPRAMGY